MCLGSRPALPDSSSVVLSSNGNLRRAHSAVKDCCACCPDACECELAEGGSCEGK